MSLGEYANVPVNAEALRRMSEAQLSAEGQELLSQLMERTRYAEALSDSTLLAILTDSARSYLNGDKTIEDTVALIQSRASIYMAEQG